MNEKKAKKIRKKLKAELQKLHAKMPESKGLSDVVYLVQPDGSIKLAPCVRYLYKEAKKKWVSL